MLNKKELEKMGHKFVKIDGKDFLDLSNPVDKKVMRCPMIESEQAMRNHFLEHSQKRGKALDVIIPLVNNEDMTELLSELYDLRVESKQRKIEDQMVNEEVNEVLGRVGKLLDHPDIVKKLNPSVDSKCHPKKNRPKNPQKKKTVKKK